MLRRAVTCHSSRMIGLSGVIAITNPVSRIIIAIVLLSLILIPGILSAQEPGLEPLPDRPDLSTPRRSLAFFLDHTRNQDFETAALALQPDLRGASSLRGKKREVLASRLAYVLEQSTTFDLNSISDLPEGNLEDGKLTEVFTSINPEQKSAARDLSLHRQWHNGKQKWFISQNTLLTSEYYYKRLGGPLLERLPHWTRVSIIGGLQLWQLVGLAGALGISLLGGWLLALPLFLLWRRLAKRTRFTWDERLLEALRKPIILLIAHLIMLAVLNWLFLALGPGRIVYGIVTSTLILAVAWFFMRFIDTIAFDIRDRLIANTDVDEWQHRSARTQVIVLRRVFNIIIWFIAGALILTRFDVLRDIGMSLLASAGVAGVVLGFAAQKSIANLLAGIQLAITQPIRIGDTVIIEDEFGTVEEIHLTYIVLKLWDLRRLVVPIQKFLDESFQNWTRNDRSLLGTVFFHVDLATPVQSLREEFERFVQSHEEWDGSVCALIVHEAGAESLRLRGLVSAADASRTFTLRCATREHIMKFLRNWENGNYMPRKRLETNSNSGVNE